jgi:hypothetical protein
MGSRAFRRIVGHEDPVIVAVDAVVVQVRGLVADAELVTAVWELLQPDTVARVIGPGMNSDIRSRG